MIQNGRRLVAELFTALHYVWYIVLAWCAIYLGVLVWHLFGIADWIRNSSTLAPYHDALETVFLGLIWALGLAGFVMLGRWVAQRVQASQRATQLLRESEARLRLFTDATADWVYWLAPDDTLLYCAPACEAITGFTAQEFINDPALVTRIIHPEDQAVFIAHRHDAANAQAGALDLRILHRDGAPRWVAHTCQPVYDEHNEFRGTRVSNRDITDRKRAEEQLGLHTAALRAAANGIVITDLAGKIVFVNPAFTRMTGYTERDALGKNPRDLLRSGKQNRAFYKNLWDAVLAGQVWHGEIVNRKKDGALYTEEMTITPVRLVGGQITHLVAVKQDITARKQAELELARAHALLRATLDSTADGILALSQDGTVATYNHKYLEMWCLDEEMLDLPWDARIAMHAAQTSQPDQFSARVNQLARQPETPQSDTIEMRDGRVIERVTAPYRLGGYLIGRVMSFRDVTAQKRLERALQTERDFAMQIINTIGQGLTVTDADGRFELVNPAYARLFGYRPADLIGKLPQDVTDPEDHAALAQARAARLRGETTSYENRLRRADGTFAPVLITGAPRREAGKVIGAIAVITDLSEIKHAEQLLAIQRDLAVALGTATTLDAALAHILDAAFEVGGVDCGGVYVVHPETGALDLAIHRGLPDAFVHSAEHYEPDMPQARLVMYGEPIYSHHRAMLQTTDHPRASEGLRALAVIPVWHSGRVVAALNLASHTRDEIPARARRAMEAIAAQIGSVLERIRAAESLRQSQTNLQTLFDSITDMVFILDANGGIVHTNAETQRRLGYPADELRRMHVLQVHPAERRAEAQTIIAAMLAGAQTHCPIPLLGKTGAPIPVETRVVRGAWNDQPALFGIARDISERLRIEAALRESETRFRSIFESSPIAIEVYDSQALLMDANRACLELFGVPDFNRVKGFSLFDDPNVPEASKAALRAGKAVRTEIEFDFNKVRDTNLYPTTKQGVVHLDALITPFCASETSAETCYLVQLQDISERKHIQAHLEYQSTHDALTDLFNRAYFDAELAHLQTRTGAPVGVVVIDVDGMKMTNDVYGHAAGDALLRQAARVLRRAFRGEDVVARIGGDEFAVLLPGADAATTQRIVERVRGVIAQHNREGDDAPISMSIGAATAERADALEQALATADAAMYLEKARKRAEKM